MYILHYQCFHTLKKCISKLNPPTIITITNYAFILGGLNISFSISLAIFIICCIDLMSEENQTIKQQFKKKNVILSPKSPKVQYVKLSRLLCPGEEVKIALSIATNQFCWIFRVHLQKYNRPFAHEHSHLEEETKKM